MEKNATEILPNSKFRERLVWAREQLGFKKQQDFADFLGEKGPTLAKAEGAKGRGASERLLYKIEEKAGISKDWLKTGKGSWKVETNLPKIGDLAHFVYDELRPILEVGGITEARLLEILSEAPPMPSESSQEYAERLVKRLKQELGKGWIPESHDVSTREYDPVRLLNMMDSLESEDQIKVVQMVEKLSSPRASRKM